jgi:hypothetical protein
VYLSGRRGRWLVLPLLLLLLVVVVVW